MPRPGADEVAASALRKVRTHLVGFLALLYFAAFIDRVNVGFAASQMHRDLGFSASVYGFGAGVFFIGYCLFEVPSNLILHRVGARRWIGRIMISWALLAGAMALVRSAPAFYALRFLLGIAEAGFFPGIIYYLTYWVPSAARARLVGTFMTAIPISTAVAGPLSGLILGLDGVLGIAGWQWLFLTETLPSLLLGFLTLRHLPDTPAQARWLSATERDWLTGRLQAESAVHAGGALRLAGALSSPRLLGLCVCYFGADLALYGVVLWIPQIFSQAGIGAAWVGPAVALPYGVAALAMILWSRRSDRRRERLRHLVIAALVGFAGLAASAFVHGSAVLAILALSVGVSGTLATLPVFWTLPAALLRGAAAAGGIALINAVGNVGGFVGPYALGWIKDATGSYMWGLMVTAAGLLLTAVAALAVGHDAAGEFAEIHPRRAAVHNAPPA
ncbi:MAG TPA: MFS transporter [Steroidobacteraceae bacterium]|nr:MFS transporter [Steroidobacteraceae bacterium]